MIETLLTLRNLAIVGGVMFTAFLVQTKRIGWLKDDVIELKAEKAQLQLNLRDAKEANDFALDTITELRATNEQCALDREANSKLNKKIASAHQERIFELNDEIKSLQNKFKTLSGCVNYTISDDVVSLLQARRDN